MKNILFLIASVLIFTCKSEKKESIRYLKQTLDVTTSIYPENITKVFDVHGGIDKWNEYASLEFTTQRSYGTEITTTDLKKRYSLVEMPNHTIGYDGENVWLKSKDTMAYDGNPRFYYNLIFYFYAMPFILGDGGIIYDDVAPLAVDDQLYPGIKISYEAGVGESPDDEYIIYYDPDTFRMTWLSYTVTYFTQEKSKEFHYIKYSDWQEIGGLLLPEKMVWYNYEDNLPTTERNELVFKDVKLLKEKPNTEIFKVPDGAELVD